MRLIVTPTQRLAAFIEKNQDHDGLVLSWSAWLNEWWEKLSEIDPQGPCRLTVWQSKRLLRTFIQANTPPLLNTSSTTHLVWEAWQNRHRWLLPVNDCALPSIDEAAFLTWTQQYQSYCQKNNLVDEVTFLNVLIKQVSLLTPLYPQELQCVGFDDWPPQWQQWLDVLKEQGVCVSYEADKRSVNQGCIAYRLTDEQTEWTAAALWVRDLLGSGIRDPIAVVIPNLSTARTDILATFNRILNPWAPFRVGEKQPKRFNISGGTPLSDAPVIETALILLDTPASSFLIQNPYVKTVPSIGLHNQFFDKIEAAHWVLRVITYLDLAGWPGTRVLHSDGYQAVLAWNDTLKTLKTDLALWGNLSYVDFYQALVELLTETLFQTQSIHEQSNVHVLGILEAAGLDFEYTWLTGLYEGQWPEAPAPNPFIDFSTQRQHNMPHASSLREITFAQKILKRLVHQSKHMVLSTPEYSELKPVLESPLIFEYTPIIQPFTPPKDTASPLTLLGESVCCDYYVDQTGLLRTEQAVSGGVSVLKTQAACPYQAYATHRLGVLAPPPKATYGLSGQERGLWLHKALERLWRTLQTQTALNACAPLALEALLEQGVRQTQPVSRGGHFMAIESDRMQTLLAQVCLFEQSRPPFKVQGTEVPQLLFVNGLQLKGRLDRMDVVEEGIWIIDYKTAPHNIDHWLQTRLIEPQLPLYALNIPQTTGIMILEIHPKGIRAHILDETTAESSAGMSWDALLEKWQASVNQLADEFKKGVAVVDPVHAMTCQYCHCQTLCRRFEGVEHER